MGLLPSLERLAEMSPLPSVTAGQGEENLPGPLHLCPSCCFLGMCPNPQEGGQAMSSP